jgi:hypothetical protein
LIGTLSVCPSISTRKAGYRFIICAMLSSIGSEFQQPSKTCLDSTGCVVYNTKMKFRIQRLKSIMLKRLAIVSIAILLLSVVAVALHNHMDGDSHDNCPICFAGNHQSAAGLWTVAYDSVPCFTEITVVASSPVFIDNFFSYSLRNRAPPV